MIKNRYKTKCVEVGNFVKIQDLDTGEVGFCQLINSSQKPSITSEIMRMEKVLQPLTNEGQVDIRTKLGSSLLKKRVGDIVVVNSKDLSKRFKVIKILS